MIKVCLGNGEAYPFNDNQLEEAVAWAKAQQHCSSYEIVSSTCNTVLLTSQDIEDAEDYTEALIGTNWATVPVLLERMK